MHSCETTNCKLSCYQDYFTTKVYSLEKFNRRNVTKMAACGSNQRRRWWRAWYDTFIWVIPVQNNNRGTISVCCGWKLENNNLSAKYKKRIFYIPNSTGCYGMDKISILFSSFLWLHIVTPYCGNVMKWIWVEDAEQFAIIYYSTEFLT